MASYHSVRLVTSGDRAAPPAPAPADDNFLKTVAVGGGYWEEVRVLCVADKEAAHMRDTLENLYFGNITPNDQTIKSGTALKEAMEQSAECEEKLTALLEGKEKTLLLRLLNAENEVCSTMALENFILGFRLGMQLTVEGLLGSDDGSLIEPNKEG